MANETPTEGMTLEEVEGQKWGSPPPDATKLMATVYQLRLKPLGTLQAEDMRALLGQQVGVEVLVPRVLDLLAQDPLLEGDYYPGDVLVALLKTPADYWSVHRDQLGKLNAILARVGDVGSEISSDIRNFQQETNGLT